MKRTLRKMENLLRFWKKRKVTVMIKGVKKSNSFADIVSKKWSMQSTPMFHLVVTMDDHVMLKNNHKINLMDGNTQKDYESITSNKYKHSG